MSSPYLSVIIPCYNEEKNLARGVLEEIHAYLKKQPFSWEVLVSDDGSIDRSASLAVSLSSKLKNFSVLKNRHAGKPFAIRSAIRKAKGKYILLTDMDQSTPISEVDKLIPWARDGYDVVIGSRGAFRKDAPLYRKIASVVFQLARRSILLPEIVDTQCGFKLLRTSLAEQIFRKMYIFSREHKGEGWKVTAYDVEMLHIAKKMGNKIIEVPVIWKDADVSSGKSRNFLSESYEMLLEIVRVRRNDILGRYA